MKSPKKEKRQEERTVFILECDGYFALCKRPPQGLLASLWQFPDVDGKLDLTEAIEQVQQWQLQVTDVRRRLERKHIFTHIVWNMRGYYLRVKTKGEAFEWFAPEQIDQNAALPTAYRQFWENRE